MIPERLEELRHEYAGEQVVVDASQPEWARFAGKIGRVMTLNANGRALVQFEGDDRAWYDIELDFLKVLDAPTPSTSAEPPDVATPVDQPTPVIESVEKKEAGLSELERARLEREAGPSES
ncbi:MAG: hypothetical protein JW818_04290 [Pirellulales bacterium]|nr:hypothetical protein [Pirellulales bacterium]